MHGSRRIFLGFYREEIGGWGRRTESVTWGGAENGEVFAMRGGYKEQIFSSGGIMTIDPVCGMRLEEKKPELQAQYAGRKYFFCSEECKQEFEADPNGYVETVAA